MQQSDEKPTFGFDGVFRMRVPSDLVPRVHAHARSRGLTSSSWIRLLIIEALEQAERGGAVREAA